VRGIWRDDGIDYQLCSSILIARNVADDLSTICVAWKVIGV
jgi:hypothetical protein